MNIVFFGNPEFARIVLESLCKTNQHNVVAVVSNATKIMGRGRKPRYTAVGEYALKKEMNIIFAQSLDDPEFVERLRMLKPDIFIVVAFRILPRSLLEIPKMGAMNLHTSLLPKYRGAAPIQHAILNGDTETGMTTFIIEPKVDTGGIILQNKIQINENDDFGTISSKMAKDGGPLIIESINALKNGFIPKPQDHSAATTACKISKTMCNINWEKATIAIQNQIRALAPSPGGITSYKGKRVKIFKSQPIENKHNENPGELLMLGKNRIGVFCSDGILELLEIQIEGKKRMDVSNWLMGSRILEGDQFEQ